MEPLTPRELAQTLLLIAESDACKNNSMLASILLITSSHVSELADAKREAESLALSLWEKHYKEYAPNFELCDSVAGVISQIDNMTTGLSKS